MSHLSPETLGALLDGALEGVARRDAERHLESCAECRELLAGLKAQDELLARSLGHDPGEVYFETFPERVAQRIRSEAASRAAAAPEAVGSWWRGLLAPRRLAWLSSAAAVVVVAVLAYVQLQETRIPLVNPELGAGQERQAAPEPEATPSAPEASQYREEAEPKQDEPAPVFDGREAHTFDSDDALTGAKAGANKRLGRTVQPPASARTTEGQSSARTQGPSEQAAQDARRNAASARSKLVPVTPGGAREDVPAGTRARDAAPTVPGDTHALNGTPVPTMPPASEANEKPADRLEGTIRALKQRAAAPLHKRADSGGAGIGQRFAVEPKSGEMMDLRAEESDVFAWTPELRARAAVADSLTARARDTGKAADHDAAAAAWGRVRVLAAPRSAADLEARCRVADERYAAWSIEVTPLRHDLAVAALKSALDLGPAGARRKYYAELLARLR